MAYEIVQTLRGTKEVKKGLIGRRCTSLHNVSMLLKTGQVCVVRETSGRWAGYYRSVGLRTKFAYWYSQPQMDY